MRVKRESFGERILNSFVGLLIGILLFLGSFVVLFINEGRENLASYARGAVRYEEGKTHPENGLVYTVGTLSAGTYASDNYLEEGSYIYIERIVEMYAYIEQEHSETRENLGGSSETVYTYTYTLEWTQNPKKTSAFKGDSNERPSDIPSGYDSWIDNMPGSTVSKASGISIGGINIAGTPDFSGAKELQLTSDNVRNLAANESVAGNLIYRANNGSHDNIKAGDVRIRFFAIKASDNGLLLARFVNNQFEPYLTGKNETLFRYFTGVESLAEAAAILEAEYQTALWIMRLVGFLMMFFGLLLIANPVMTLLAVIPIFARIGRAVYAVIAFITSLVLTGLTILIAMIFNNVYLAIGAVVLLVAIVVLILNGRRKRKASKS